MGKTVLKFPIWEIDKCLFLLTALKLRVLGILGVVLEQVISQVSTFCSMVFSPGGGSSPMGFTIFVL